MSKRTIKQAGMSLIVAMIMLLVITILVLSGLRNTTMSERMSGNHMDRTRAYETAEQGITQGLAVLQNNPDACLSGCTSASGINNAGLGASSTTLPSSWSDTDAVDITKATGQKTGGKFVINQLTDAGFVPTAKAGCMPYSVMAKGVGLDSNTTVILQTIAFACPM